MAKKALLVGINDYAPVGAGGPDLRGCVNDVVDMATTLRDLGIVPAAPANMHIVTDARATRDNILAELKWLVTGAKKGDLLVFYYSGHGSYVADLSGDEPDKKDETICPHDFAAKGMIKDDDLRGAFKGIAAGVNLEVILDSCHSGTATRGSELIPEEDRITPRFIEPPIDVSFFVDYNPTIPVKRFLAPVEGKKEAVIVDMNHVLWSGCKDNQTSGEGMIGGNMRGFLTYCFCRNLRAKNGNVSRIDLDKMIASCLKSLKATQTPQLECTRTCMTEKVFT
jgi:metacaspase-1